MSEGGLIALVSGISVLITAAVTGTVTYLAARRQHKAQDIDDAIKRYQNLLDMYSKHIVELTEELGEVREDHTNCQVEIQAIYVWAEHSQRLNQSMARKLGMDASEYLQPLPQRQVRERSDASAFRSRSLAQNAIILQQQTQAAINPAQAQTQAPT